MPARRQHICRLKWPTDSSTRRATFLVSQARTAGASDDQAVVQREKLQPDDASRGQAGGFQICNEMVTRPGRLPGQSDHCKNSVL